MKKKVIIIVSSIILVLAIITTALLIINHNKKVLTQEIENTKNKITALLEYVKGSNISDDGVITISAKFKGAHGEHYPRESIYNFKSSYDNGTYNVLIGDNENYVEKQYKNSLYNIYRNLIKTEYDLKKLKINDDNTFDPTLINEVLGEDYKTCKLVINTEGIIKKIKDTKITCDNFQTIIKDKNIVIEYNNNKINIDISKQGYALNINDELRMNAFLEEEKNKYSIVIGSDVFYVETYDNKLHLNASTSKSIYNAMEFIVEYQPVEIEKKKVIDEIEVPIIRYFNEYDFTYWRD